MPTYDVGYFVGSLSSTSINRVLSRALIRVAPDDLRFTEIPIGNLPLYTPDADGDYPPEPRALKDAIAASDAILFITPEYNRSIPGALKNAIDWASRPWGQNSFDHVPAAVIGASIGQIGTAVGQQSLRAVLSFCNARQMTAPEAYIFFRPGLFTDDGGVTDESTEGFLRNYMQEFRDHVERVLTVLPERSARVVPFRVTGCPVPGHLLVTPGARLGFRLLDLEEKLADVCGRPVDLVARGSISRCLRERDS